MKLVRKIVDGLGSFWLAIVTLSFMLAITFLGTIVQDTTMSLYDAQRVYFESWYVMQPLLSWVADSPGSSEGSWRFLLGGDENWIVAPLPGGVTLMALLSVNLLIGGIIRMKWRWNRAGILIVHFGVAFMMIAGLVKFTSSDEGLLALYEGGRSAEYYSVHELEVVVAEPLGDGKYREYVLTDGLDRLKDQGAAEEARGAGKLGRALWSVRGWFVSDGLDWVTLSHPSLPFQLDLHDFYANCTVSPKGPMFEVDVPVVDGYFLNPRPRVVSSNMRNLPGCYATAKVDGKPDQVGILWALDDPPRFTSDPWTVEAGGKQYAVKLRNRMSQMPFEVRVDDFEAEFFPGSRMAKSYRSDITVFDGDEEFTQRIQMNEPLRRDGYILFQTNWGPQKGNPEKLYSVFSVVTNPSDKWPEYSCWIIGLGLVIHFGWMLLVHIMRQTGGKAS